jgi:hypothetical protein
MTLKSDEAVIDSMYQDGRYAKQNPDWHGADAAWKAGQIAGTLRRNAVTFERCVEVGCGTGLVLEHLSDLMPARSYGGYDISSAAPPFWKKRRKDIVFHNTDFTKTGVQADLLLLIDVFEHVPDYMGFLTALSCKSEWFVFHIPLEMHVSGLLRDRHLHAREKVGHLHYFSKATALATLKDCGYLIVAADYTLLSQQTVEGVKAVTRFTNIVRKLIQILSPDLAAKLLGGYSLLVVGKKQSGASAS